MVYDTREQLTNPMKGIWTEVLFRYAPSFLGNEMAHNKIAVIHRQYLTLVDKKLSFAYRLWYNGSIGGQPTPFYARPYLTASYYYEGFGGVHTLRGVLLNRAVGEDFILGNFELRWKMKYFHFLNQKCYLGSNFFFDAGQITKPVNWDLSAVPDYDRDMFFEDTDGLHKSLGFGLKLAMNENFVVSFDYGMTLDERDGPGGFYLVMNYLF